MLDLPAVLGGQRLDGEAGIGAGLRVGDEQRSEVTRGLHALVQNAHEGGPTFGDQVE